MSDREGEPITAREALLAYLVEQGVRQADDPPDAWFDDPWYRYPIGGRRVPVFPLFLIRRSLTLHDLNHLISGYDLSLRGEVENAAWELGSGGCGRYVFFWVDRTIIVLLGLLSVPRTVVRAFRAGRSCRNLYQLDPNHALAASIDDLRRWASGDLATVG
ncbi:MAG: hypothetical protein ABFS46_07810 [Myxococcota bacterium]